MFSWADRLSLSAVIFNSVVFIVNWAIIIYYIRELWKEYPVLAPCLLIHVIISNVVQGSIFSSLAWWASHPLSDYDHPDDFMTHDWQRSLRRRGPFSEPTKEV